LAPPPSAANREKAAHMYSTLPYFVSQVVVDIIPSRYLTPMAFGVIVYNMVGLNNTNPDSVKFSFFLIVLVLVNVSAASVCFVVR
jgi:hypothetical protein